MSKYNRNPVYGSFFSRYHDFSDFKNDTLDNNRVRIEKIDKFQRMPVDQYCSQDFALSQHGWPMSDLALLAKAQTQKEFELAVARIRELNLPSVNNEGKTVQEILSSVLPSWVRTPAEYQRYVSYYSSFGASSRSVNPLPGEDDQDVESDKGKASPSS